MSVFGLVLRPARYALRGYLLFMKDIPDYEWRYSVTREGHFYSFVNSYWRRVETPHQIKARANNKRWGYLYVTLRDWKWWAKNWIAHRLVAITYLPNPDNLPEINHKNWDKNDISVENLEWCTSSYNKIHKFRVLWYKNSEKSNQMARERMSKKVALLWDKWEIVQTFSSATEATKFVWWKKGNIHTCCRWNTSTAYGRKWKYI